MQATGALILIPVDLGTAQILATLISIAVAVAAVFVAIRARDVAERAVEVSRRQMALQAVPYLVCGIPYDNPRRGDQWMLRVNVTVTGAAPALGIRASAYGSETRFGSPATDIARSGRHANLAPGDDPRQLSMPLSEHMRTAGAGGTWRYRFWVVTVDFYGPHGAHIEQAYDWDREGGKWRIRRVTIEPADGGPPIVSEVSL